MKLVENTLLATGGASGIDVAFAERFFATGNIEPNGSDL